MTRTQPTQVGPSLEKVAVFSGLPADAIARIQKRCSWRTYATSCIGSIKPLMTPSMMPIAAS